MAPERLIEQQEKKELQRIIGTRYRRFCCVADPQRTAECVLRLERSQRSEGTRRRVRCRTSRVLGKTDRQDRGSDRLDAASQHLAEYIAGHAWAGGGQYTEHSKFRQLEHKQCPERLTRSTELV